MWYQNQHWNGSWYGSARPLIRSQIQNIRLRCHGIRLPRARLHEKSSEEGEYINSSFRCSLLPSSPPLSLSFTKKKTLRCYGVCCSSLLLKCTEIYTWSALLLFLLPSYPKTKVWDPMGPFLFAASLSPKSLINSCHEISLAFSNNFINTTLLSAPDTTSKMENLCAMFAFEV